MSANILLIYEEGVLGRIIKNTVQSEISGSEVDMAVSLDEIVRMIQEKKYDVVLCQREMEEIAGTDARNMMISNKVNRETPFVIMTSSYETVYKELTESGIRYILPLPFSPFQLRDMLSKAANLGLHRQHARYEIPETKAGIRVKGSVITARVINFSMGGFLCEFIYPEKCFKENLIRASEVEILFPKSSGVDPISELSGLPVRIQVESYLKEQYPEKMKFAYKFINISAEVLKVFEKVIESLHR